MLTRITETTSWRVAELTPGKWADKNAPTEKSDVDAVGVVAFAYDIYTTPRKSNGALRATLTHKLYVHGGIEAERSKVSVDSF